MVLLFNALKTELTRRSCFEMGEGKTSGIEQDWRVQRAIPSVRTGTQVLWGHWYFLSEFVPQSLLHTRVYFPFSNVLVCFMQDCLHGYEEHARNFRFKVTSRLNTGDLGFEQT